jgi:hypothetical protein
MKNWILILSLCLPFGSYAQSDVCKPDVKKFCAKISGGKHKQYMCLRDHLDELEPDCKIEIAALKAKREEALKVCHEDFEKLCKKKNQSGEYFGKCLRKNKEKLSAACAPYFSGVDPK